MSKGYLKVKYSLFQPQVTHLTQFYTELEIMYLMQTNIPQIPTKIYRSIYIEQISTSLLKNIQLLKTATETAGQDPLCQALQELIAAEDIPLYVKMQEIQNILNIYKPGLYANLLKISQESSPEEIENTYAHIDATMWHQHIKLYANQPRQYDSAIVSEIKAIHRKILKQELLTASEKVKAMIDYRNINPLCSLFSNTRNQENISYELGRFLSDTTASKIWIIINEHNTHWTSLLLEKTSAGIQGYYIDPLGNQLPKNSKIAQEIKLAIKANGQNLLPFKELLNKINVIQKDGHSCGPLTIELSTRLSRFLQNNTDQDIDNFILSCNDLRVPEKLSALRESHIVALKSNPFYIEEYDIARTAGESGGFRLQSEVAPAEISELTQQTARAFIFHPLPTSEEPLLGKRKATTSQKSKAPAAKKTAKKAKESEESIDSIGQSLPQKNKRGRKAKRLG
jgi:hypothetical protein